MDNIILIGMPAVGKSTVGVIVAKRLGYNFVDTDLVIQEKEGKLLREIIAEVGPDGFLEVEDGESELIHATEVQMLQKHYVNIKNILRGKCFVLYCCGTHKRACYCHAIKI